jgi:general secretion pathway protein I
MQQRQRGFTLIEVLVALGIVAVALAAGARAAASLTRNAERQTDQMLAHLCAENALIATRLSRQMPAVGESNRSCEQADRRFTLSTAVATTPNPNFLRVEARVLEADIPVLSLATVVGRY